MDLSPIVLSNPYLPITSSFFSLLLLMSSVCSSIAALALLETLGCSTVKHFFPFFYIYMDFIKNLKEYFKQNHMGDCDSNVFISFFPHKSRFFFFFPEATTAKPLHCVATNKALMATANSKDMLVPQVINS